MITLKSTNSYKKKSNKNNKSRKWRPSPVESATSLSEGSIRIGGDGNRWVIKSMSNGIPRWIPIEICVMNGWKLLTVDYISKNIGKNITYYSRMYNQNFPKKTEKMEKAIFIPNGHAQVNKKKTLLYNWLKTQSPPVKPGSFFSLLGSGTYGSIQVDSKHPQQVSDNIMNMEAFIKVK
jgi:hypothetical protein